MEMKKKSRIILVMLIGMVFFMGCSAQAKDSQKSEATTIVTDAKGEVEIPTDP